jgi:regulator of sigma E protease
MSVVLGLLILNVLVFVHELGHFLVAKAFGVRVEKFSIGFGPVLLSKRMGGTIYALSAIPLGGFVKMAGENPDEPEREGAPDELLSKHWAKRLAIVVAGPLANLALALVANCLVGVFGFEVSTQPNVIESAGPEAAAVGFLPGDRIVGVGETPVESWRDFATALEEVGSDAPAEVRVDRAGSGEAILVIPPGSGAPVIGALIPRTEPVVGEVAPGMPAFQAGLRSGDRVVAVNGTPVATWEAMRELVNAHPDEMIRLEFERDGRSFTSQLRTMASKDPVSGRTVGVIGITLPTVTVSIGPRESLMAGLLQTRAMIALTYKGFWELVSKPRDAVRQVAGPITIAQIAGDSGLGAPGVLLTRAAWISIALMAMNLLPIPILDGGHGLFCIIEGLRGSPVPVRRQLAFQKLGLVILGSLVVFALVNDSLRLVERARAKHKLEKQEPATGSP